MHKELNNSQEALHKELNNSYKTLIQLNAQNIQLSQKLKRLEERPHFAWRLYEFIRCNHKKKLYILGFLVLKIKENQHRTIKKIYLFGIPIWIHHRK